MQKVLGVLMVSSTLIQCATTKKPKQPKQYSNNNTIKIYKSKNELFTGFSIDAHIDHEHKINIPTMVYIDNILLSNYERQRGLDDVPSLVIDVKPDKKYKLDIFSMGYLPTKKMKFFVKQGDSVVVKSYLKRDKRMMYNYKKR